ncbi:MAG: dihydroorotate dehydrogenase-like protein [Spirochaetales bacterium]|nr:dihydroorotate dehydrogenase-like protein [Spirochaetales bacterium]
MLDTSVQYLGHTLRTPIVISSSGLTNTMSGIRQAAEAGAGAVVLKSLFEEQIESTIETDGQEMELAMHPEAEQYISQMGMHLGPQRYLELIGEAKAAVDIPIIASMNCVTSKWWGNYGKQIEAAGADAVELNIAIMPRDESEPAEAVEKRYLRIVDRVRQQIDLPLAVKIGPYFTGLPKFASELRKAGASALVLFNRFYQMDIDIEDESLAPGYQFSTPEEIYTSLRWVSILSGDVGCDLSASTGIHSADGVIKQLLAGATTVQMCSALYRSGFEIITRIRDDLTAWMERKGYKSISDFQGKLSQSASDDPESYERLQYIKALTGIS